MHDRIREENPQCAENEVSKWNMTGWFLEDIHNGSIDVLSRTHKSVGHVCDIENKRPIAVRVTVWVTVLNFNYFTELMGFGSICKKNGLFL